MEHCVLGCIIFNYELTVVLKKNIALACAKAIEPIFPMIMDFVNNNDEFTKKINKKK
jgi:hypothetical protein